MTDLPPGATTAASSSSSSPSRRRRGLQVGLGLVVAIAAVWTIVSTAGGIGDAAGAVGRMRPGFVALALGFAALRMVLFGIQLLSLGRRSGPLSRTDAMSLSLVVYGLGAITPAAPAEGMALAGRALRERGRSPRDARLVVGFSEWFAQRTFYGIAALDLLAVVALGHLSWAEAWPFALVAAVVLLALVGTAMAARRPGSAMRISALLAALRLRRPAVPQLDHRQAASEWHAAAMAVVGPPRHRARLALLSASAVLADAATLWATCHAAGFHIHPELALLARTVGTVVSWVPLLPGGLGLVEAAIPTVLHRFGVPLDDALAATLVYRAAGTLLPAVAGGFALAVLRSGRGLAVAAGSPADPSA